METEWEDRAAGGLLPAITSLEKYEVAYTKGLGRLRKELSRMPAPITSADDLKALHKTLFDEVAPWAGTFHWKQHLIGGRPGSDPDMRDGELDLLAAQMGELAREETTEANVIRIATFYHARLVGAHIFPDGNGRLTRTLLNHYLETRLSRPPTKPLEKRSYLDALKQTLDTEDLAPLGTLLAEAWEAKLERGQSKSPFRLTPLQIEPNGKSWLETTRRPRPDWFKEKRKEAPTIT